MTVTRKVLPFAVVTIVLALGLAGCGKKAPSGAGAPAAPDTLAKVRSAGVLHWGADAAGGAPFVYYDPKNVKRVIGFEIDLMEKFAAHLGVKQEMVQGEWDGLIDNMMARRSDMVVNGIEINEERAKRVAFSVPYYEYEQQLTVRAGDKDKYHTLDDLKGHKVATLKAAEANNVLKRAGWTDELIKPYDDSTVPYTELKLGRADAVLQESIIAAFYAGEDAEVYNIPKTFSPGKYAFALRPEDASLLAETNRILNLMKQNGELAAIYAKWDIWNDRQTALGIQKAAATGQAPAQAPAKSK